MATWLSWVVNKRYLYLAVGQSSKHSSFDKSLHSKAAKLVLQCSDTLRSNAVIERPIIKIQSDNKAKILIALRGTIC